MRIEVGSASAFMDKITLSFLSCSAKLVLVGDDCLSSEEMQSLVCVYTTVLQVKKSRLQTTTESKKTLPDHELNRR